MIRLCYIATSIVLALCFTGCKGRFEKEKYQKPAQVIIDEPKSNEFHVVVHGEDIASIAKRYGMKRSALVELNDLKPPYKLFAGQKLIVVRSEYVDDNLKDGHDNKVSKSAPSSSGLKSVRSGVANTMFEEASYCVPVAGFFSKIVKEYSSLDPFVVAKCDERDDIFCVADGVVKFVGFLDGESAQHGKSIIVRHADLKTISLYCGLDNIFVKVGENVAKGQIIATPGKPEKGAICPQLKYRIDKIIDNGTKSVNPRELIMRI